MVDRISPPTEEFKQRFNKKFNDLGKFTYLENGFILKTNSENYNIEWTDIEILNVYKVDLIITDEICMDIVFNNLQITITEETQGWYQFVEKTKDVFPTISKNWDTEIINPAFEKNFKTIFQREDRLIPEENNFYASFNNISKTRIKDLFEQNKWAVRKASWKDFELKNIWTELILEGDEKEPLLNGKVSFHKDNIKILDQLFNSLSGHYTYEFYDLEKKLLLEKENGN
jgi:hypothetical protein